jgi:SAM-dependent methyltransferase
MHGCVVDLGGKRLRKRGAFRPPSNGVTSWICVNLDPITSPHVFGSVTQVPLRTALADCVICTEVLEHVTEPEQCVSEAHRILKPGGTLVGAVPFLYPVHGDPQDFQRFTSDGVRRLLGSFAAVDVRPMGGYFGSLGLLVELGIQELRGATFGRRAAGRVLRLVARALVWLDLRRARSTHGVLLPAFANGFFFVARKS